MPAASCVLFCQCRCHFAIGDPFWRRGPHVRDVAAAAVACPACLNDHCPALLKPVEPPREMTPWADPPIKPTMAEDVGGGDGPE